MTALSATLAAAGTTALSPTVERFGVVAIALLAGVAVLGHGSVVGAVAAHGGGGARNGADRPSDRRWNLRPSSSVGPRAHAAALLAVLLLTPALLLSDLWSTSQIRHLRAHPLELAVAIAAGLLVVAVLAGVIRRRPAALALLAVAALPFRVPISTGGSTSNLLVPLYVVVAAGALARLAEVLRAPPPDRGERPQRAQGWLEWLLVAFVVTYAVQSTYSSDFQKGLENVVFFYVPFALLFDLLRGLRWDRRLLAGALAIVVGEAVLFSGIGFVEYATHHVLLNPKVVQANDYDSYFRVNSLFFDPSIYGRFLALVMLLVTTGVLWAARRRRDVAIAALLLVWLLAGLVTSFSQSSVAALLLGLAVLAALRWSVRDTALVCAGLACLAVAVALVAPSGTHIGLGTGSHSADKATSGRYSLVTKGIDLWADRPLYGFGAGSFSTEYLRHDAQASADTATSASHTIPVTVAAEQGLIGLALYLALLVAAFGRLGRDAARSPARIALLAAFAALVLHTLVYADFLEDPFVWTLLALGAALAARSPVVAVATDEQAAAVAGAVVVAPGGGSAGGGAAIGSIRPG